jgi:hypothetical protein
MDVLDLTCYDIVCLLEVHEFSTEDDGDPKLGSKNVMPPRLLLYNSHDSKWSVNHNVPQRW